jgi:potassium-transporting ATPase KdpC subunit
MEAIKESVVRPTLVLFAVLTVIVGLAYPAVVTAISQAVFPDQANGSILVKDGKPVGSALIGQAFSDPKHFWGRPSATSPMAYNAANSGGSNLGPLNPALTDAVKARIAALHSADPGNTAPVPVDLVTASGSGLDPHISVAAAHYQVARVAKARGLSQDQVAGLVERSIERPTLPLLGEPVVNVLRLNLALDGTR